MKNKFNKILKSKRKQPKETDTDPQVAQKKRHSSRNWWMRIPMPIRKGLIAFVVIFGLVGLFSGAAFAWYAFVYLDPTMDLGNIDNSLDYTTVVYATDSAGKTQEIEHLYKDENRIWVSLGDIPTHLQQAFIAIEDQRFYKHNGVDWIRTGGAVIGMVTGSDSYGGSTITQQLIKNLTGDDDVKISRKIQEIRRALYLEKEYNKNQILEAYLNTIYLSQGCNGVQTAAKVYFNKNVQDLTLAESACIAAITKYPTKYDPYGDEESRAANKERQETILNKMAELEMITKEQAQEAKEVELVFENGSKKETDSKQSYFVEELVDQVIEDLVEEKGYSYSYASSMVYSGGLSIYSTVEPNVQAILDDAYAKTSTFTSYELYSNGETPQSAMVILNNSTGAVAAMVGGRGEKTIGRGLNRATSAYRQPGSCMKPIGTYAPAFEYKVRVDGTTISPGTMVLDSYVRDAWPVNYDVVTNKLMSIQTAISKSTNTVAVKVNMALGADRAYKFLEENLGVTSLVPGSDKDANSSATALGGMTKGISVLEITAAYAAFPNNGTYTEPYYYTKVVDSNGKVLLEKTPKTNVAMSESTAAMINMLLRNAATSGTGSPANFGTTAIAGKTGTTSDSKDRWFVGYTSYYTAAVWYGFDQPVRIQYGGTNPAVKAWRTVMSQVHEGLSYKSFNEPTNLTSISYCSESGQLPTELCKKANTVVSGMFLPGVTPTETCTVHVEEEKPKEDQPQNTQDPQPQKPSKDEETTPKDPEPPEENPQPAPQQPTTPEDPSNPTNPDENTEGTGALEGGGNTSGEEERTNQTGRTGDTSLQR